MLSSPAGNSSRTNGRRWRVHDPKPWLELVGMLLKALVAIVRAVMDGHGLR